MRDYNYPALISLAKIFSSRGSTVTWRGGRLPEGGRRVPARARAKTAQSLVEWTAGSAAGDTDNTIDLLIFREEFTHDQHRKSRTT